MMRIHNLQLEIVISKLACEHFRIDSGLVVREATTMSEQPPPQLSVAATY